MDYRIMYDCTGEAKHVAIWKIWAKYLGITAIIVLLIVSVIRISGMDWQVMVSAMERMAETLRQGEDFTDAYFEFCFDILQGAELG